MSDHSIYVIARALGKAMMTRAKSRSAEDQQVVLALQTQLVAEILNEEKSDAESLVLN